jgi:phage terminase large subunit-like protein
MRTGGFVSKRKKSAGKPRHDANLSIRVHRFFERALHHSKGQKAGKPFLLMGWQKKVLSDIFATVKQDGTRQYRTAYIELGRAPGPQWLGGTPQ